MSDSEIITIMIGFHLGAHKTFKHYYKQIVCGYWKDLFPKSLSYNRFLELQQRSFVVFALFLKEKCLGKCTGISFMDSTTLKVCRKEFIIIRFSKDWQNVENLQWVGFMDLNCLSLNKRRTFILLFNERQCGRQKSKTHQKNDRKTFRKTFRRQRISLKSFVGDAFCGWNSAFY
ncbi:hypothetical protein SAMN05216273_11637 [Chryseobacterium taihuense]|uniref:Transposase DDE domain-containing protein n=1 Tax=Chryseobacterium taihuense TaxID=1141221 RepID=A0ABY0R023_9FLAO|nr:hypothetical protein SAMN05216273_11637 [Chryseobacterium taihuense]